MRSVNPIFNQSNIGGPFAPVIIGDSVRISYDSFLFKDGTDLSSAVRLSMPPVAITESLKVYLRISFNAGAYVDAEIIDSNNWWSTYPNVIKYSGDSKKIEDQVELYAPIFSAFKGPGVFGKYVNTDQGELTVYRHMTNNVMLMQACKYYFLLPAPFSPQVNN